VERASGDDSRGDEGVAGDSAHPRQVHRSYGSNVHTHLLPTPNVAVERAAALWRQPRVLGVLLPRKDVQERLVRGRRILVTHEMCGLGMTTRRLPGMHYTTTSLGADGGRGALGRPVAMERSDAGVALVTGPAPGLS
jgi:hypothetical protein